MLHLPANGDKVVRVQHGHNHSTDENLSKTHHLGCSIIFTKQEDCSPIIPLKELAAKAVSSAWHHAAEKGTESRNSSPNFSNFLFPIRQTEISASGQWRRSYAFPRGSWELGTTPVGFRYQINQLQGCFFKKKNKLKKDCYQQNAKSLSFFFFLLAGNRYFFDI